MTRKARFLTRTGTLILIYALLYADLWAQMSDRTFAAARVPGRAVFTSVIDQTVAERSLVLFGHDF